MQEHLFYMYIHRLALYTYIKMDDGNRLEAHQHSQVTDTKGKHSFMVI